MADWHAYKAEKEAFVAGQVGSSVAQINFVCATALASYVLWASARRYALCASNPATTDWLLLVVPMSLACTALSEHVGALFLAMLGLAVILYTASGAPSAQAASAEPQPKVAHASSSQHPDDRTATKATHGQASSVLTIYRTYLMILTVLCILAVDFRVFPRAFAKCESWGTSLMDLGVGSFVFSHGLVSVRAQRRPQWRRTVRRTLPLLVLGLARVVLVKRTEYPEHVSEYGVHWNFFLTLGVVIPAIDVLQACMPWPMAIAGVVLSAVYEVVLMRTPLGAWSLSDMRDAASLVSLNKEGLTSLPGMSLADPGYLAIAMLGLDVGTFVREAGQVIPRLAWRTCVYWGLYATAAAWGLVASRRMVRRRLTQANLPYVLWTAAFNTLFLLCFSALHALWSRHEPRAASAPVLFEWINRHSLLVFLLVCRTLTQSNVATGLINLHIQTMHCTTPEAMLILGAYLALVLGVAPWATTHWPSSISHRKNRP